jgi:hypothetical protein
MESRNQAPNGAADIPKGLINFPLHKNSRHFGLSQIIANQPENVARGSLITGATGEPFRNLVTQGVRLLFRQFEHFFQSFAPAAGLAHHSDLALSNQGSL